jgi:hypothetical protein
MSKSNINREISERIMSFLNELSAMVRQAALESVTQALGASAARESTEEAAPRARKSRRSKARRAGRPATRGDAKKATRGKKGSKRSPRQLVTLTNKLLTEIKANPGQRIEQIAKKLGVRTKKLALPIKKLLAGDQLVKKGEKRATAYFPR